MRPLAKLAMRGVVTATELTSAGRRGLQDLHAEVKAEREQKTAAAAPEIPAQPASPESAESSASG